MATPQAQHGRRRSPLIAIAAIAAVVALSDVWDITRDHQATVERSYRQAEDMAGLTRDYTERVLAHAEATIDAVTDLARRAEGIDDFATEQTWLEVRRLSASLGLQPAVIVYDGMGAAVLNSRQFPTSPLSARAQDYFRAGRDGEPLALGAARLSDTGIGPVFTVAKPIFDPDGGFQGVVAIELPLAQVMAPLARMTFAPNPLFTLARSDGMILARLPDLDGSIGASIATGRLFREELARAPAGRFRSLSPIDGLDRFAGYATEAEFGVITIVGMGVDDALAGWRDRALLTAAKGLASFAILTLVILWDSRMRARVRKVETELIEAVSVSVQATAALQQAQHDRLTGLAGRALFEQQVPARIAEAAASGGALAYLLIDLDGFKAVNDRFGHAAGDEVLIKAAAVLTEAVRGGDLTARLGGDEFAVVATAPPETIEVTARRVAQRIVDGMAGIGQGIGCSVGIALVTDPQTTLAEGLDAADQAMYAAKRAGKGVYRIYEAA